MRKVISILLLALPGLAGCAFRDQGNLSVQDVTGVYESTWHSSDRERNFTYKERATLSPSGSISFHFTLSGDLQDGEDVNYDANKMGTYRLDGDRVISDVFFDWRDGVKWCLRPINEYYTVSADLGRAYVTGESLVFRRAEGGKALELNGRRLVLQSQATLASR